MKIKERHRSELLKEIKVDSQKFVQLPNSLKDDKDFILKAIEALNQNNYAYLSNISDALKADKDIALKMIEKEPLSINFINAELRDDKEVIIFFLKQDSTTFSDFLNSNWTVKHFEYSDELESRNIKTKSAAIKYFETQILEEALGPKDYSKEAKYKKPKI